MIAKLNTLCLLIVLIIWGGCTKGEKKEEGTTVEESQEKVVEQIEEEEVNKPPPPPPEPSADYTDPKDIQLDGNDAKGKTAEFRVQYVMLQSDRRLGKYVGGYACESYGDEPKYEFSINLYFTSEQKSNIKYWTESTCKRAKMKIIGVTVTGTIEGQLIELGY